MRSKTVPWRVAPEVVATVGGFDLQGRDGTQSRSPSLFNPFTILQPTLPIVIGFGFLFLLLGCLFCADAQAKWSAVQVAAGGTHTCALLNDGLVKCWGENNFGQLGLGDSSDRGDAGSEMGGTLPFVDLGVDASGNRLKAVELAAGGTFTCARLDTGAVKCWGLNGGEFGSATGHGHLGLNDFDVTSSAAAQIGLRVIGDQPGEMGRNLSAAFLTDESEPANTLRALGISAGNEHACARLENGEVKCWGHNDSGRLGRGDLTEAVSDDPGEMGPNLDPVSLGTGLTALQLSAGYSRTCAVLGDGSVKCWGRNISDCNDLRGTASCNDELSVFYEDGQLGLALRVESSFATENRGDEPGEMGGSLDAVPLLPSETDLTATALSMGPLSHHACAIFSDGQMKCWGSNWYGQLGLGDRENRGDDTGEGSEMGEALPFLAFGEGRRAAQVATGEFFTCAVLDDGSVRCWGNNFFGQLGQGTVTDSLLPVEVNLGTGVQAAAVAAGTSHVCARLRDGAVKCWGNNSHGQLGLGDALNRGNDEPVAPLPVVDLGGPTVEATDANATDPNPLDVPRLQPDPGRFTFSLGGAAAPAGGVVLNYHVSDGDVPGQARQGEDFQTLSGSVLIPEGQTTATVDVIPVPDTNCLEGLETLTLTLVPDANGFVDPTAPANSASVVIADACRVPVSATFEPTDPNASETGADTGRFTVSVGSDEPSTVTLAYSVTGTASAADDYQALTGTIIIPAGQSSATVEVTPIDDGVCEGAETVTATLLSPAQGEATVVIADDDCDASPNAAQVAASKADAAERRRKPGEFTVRVSPAPAAATTVSYAVAGTATEGEDFEVLPGTAVIPAGATSVAIPVRVRNDRLKEGPESVVLTLRSAPGYPLKAPMTATVMIADDESPNELAAACEVKQLEAAAQLYRDLATCQRGRLRSGDEAVYQDCRTAAKTAFAARFDNITAYEGGCELTLAGTEVSNLWGELMDSVIDPLLDGWELTPRQPFRTSARLRRFFTASRAVERSIRNALLKAEIPYVQEGNEPARRQSRKSIDVALVHKMQNVQAARADYTGPRASEFKTLVNAAVNAVSAQVSDPTQLEPLQVAAGDGFTCARFNNLKVKCWGGNAAGQLGLGDQSARGDQTGEMADNLPFVNFGAGWLALELAVGGRHACVRLNGGFVKCWGDNSFGQLGLGDSRARGDSAGEMGDDLSTVDLGAGRSAVEIKAGDVHTCARLDDGSIKCWGGNSNGQLGLGDASGRGTEVNQMGDALPAVDLGPDTQALELGLGFTHSCARLNGGSVKCWGQNLDGALGLGDTASRGDDPDEMGAHLQPVNPGFNVNDLEAGGHFTCALSETGALACWGQNAAGQLGAGRTDPRGDSAGEMTPPLPLIDLGAGRKAEKLSLGFGHACASLDDGSAKCWGRNDSGQLGLGDTLARGDAAGEMGDALTAVDLGSGRLVEDLVSGRSHTCARLDDRTVKCWGANVEGGLGQGDTVERGSQAGQMGDNLPAVNFGSASAP